MSRTDGRWVRWVTAQRWPTASAALGIDATIRQAPFHRAPQANVTRVPLQLGPGCSVELLEAKAGGLRSALRCAHVNVERDYGRGDRAVLVLGWSWRPEPSGYPPVPMQLGLFPPDACAPLPLGIDLDGEPVTVSLFDRDAGANRLLIGGVPGTGKTNALRTILAGLAPTTAQLVFLDPSGGAEATKWADRASRVVATADPAETCRVLRQVLDLVEARSTAVAQGVPIAMLRPVLVVVDELAEIAAAGTTKEQDEARGLLRRVCALGRKAQVGALLATQRTTATSIDTTTRAFATHRLALAHPGDRHGSEALLGPGRYQAADLAAGDVGVGFLTDGRLPRLVSVYWTSSERALADPAPIYPLDELLRLETTGAPVG